MKPFEQPMMTIVNWPIQNPRFAWSEFKQDDHFAMSLQNHNLDKYFLTNHLHTSFPFPPFLACYGTTEYLIYIQDCNNSDDKTRDITLIRLTFRFHVQLTGTMCHRSYTAELSWWHSSSFYPLDNSRIDSSNTMPNTQSSLVENLTAVRSRLNHTMRFADDWRGDQKSGSGPNIYLGERVDGGDEDGEREGGGVLSSHSLSFLVIRSSSWFPDVQGLCWGIQWSVIDRNG